MPKEILDLILRVLGENTNTADIAGVVIRWDELSPVEIELTIRR